MNKLIKIGSILFIPFFILIGQASADVFLDTYHGGDDPYGYGDVIGDWSKFNISSADISRSGNLLSVKIYTNFAGRGHLGDYSAYTQNPYIDDPNKERTGIGYGDLFLGAVWDPYQAGDGPAFSSDNAVNGTQWSYVFSLGAGRWNETGGSGTFYALDNSSGYAGNILTSDAFMTGSARWRENQEIAISPQAISRSLGDFNWAVDTDHLLFMMDISGTDLATSDYIAIHWAMTCGNDTTEGQVPNPVPEPASMFLLGCGLIGLAGIGRRKFIKK